MIRHVHCTELRQLFADILITSKKNFTKYRSNFSSEFDLEPTEDEIDDLIISTQCFDNLVRDFLLSGDGYWLLDDGDVEGLRSNLILWAERHNSNGKLL